MKRLITTIIALVMLFSLTACVKEKTPSMQLIKAEMTEEEQDIIELLKLDNSADIFDFAVDETVKTICINSYELDENGQWKMISGGGGVTLDGTSGRIALSFEKIPNGIRTAIQDENGTCASSHTIPESIDTSNMATATAFANNTTEIIYEKEIPVAVQIITSKNDINLYDVEYYFQPQEYQKYGYEHVYAITITFSQKPLS